MRWYASPARTADIAAACDADLKLFKVSRHAPIKAHSKVILFGP